MLKKMMWLVALIPLALVTIYGTPAEAGEVSDSSNLHIHKYFGESTGNHDGSELEFGELPELPPLRGARFELYEIMEDKPLPGTDWEMLRQGSVLTFTKDGAV